MLNSTTAARPAKPRPDFPLFPHASGRWAKKVLGQFKYFGRWAEDPTGEAAIVLWLDQKDALLAGRTPRAKVADPDVLTLHELCNAFMASKEQLVNDGERSIRTLKGYERVGKLLLKTFGKTKLVTDMSPDDFMLLRKKFSGLAVTSRAMLMQSVRSIFNFAHNRKQRLISQPVLFGEGFDPPNTDALKKHRNAKKKSRKLTADQIKALVNAGSVHFKAMVLLGINAGFGNSDLAALRIDDLDLEKGWVDNCRHKTAVERRAKLWPETVAAIKESIDRRPRPAEASYRDRVFLTRGGLPYVRWSGQGLAGKWLDCLSAVSIVHFRKLGINGGASFYSLRRMTKTEGGSDREAVSVVMGHTIPGMSETYRLEIADSRLEAVATTIHEWLWPEDGKVVAI